ncbi:YqkE family protein [Paenibacillus sp. P25]|nr:YqkE family protein [Paenibacillus sp. P25]
MAKKRPITAAKPEAREASATLKDLLSPEVLGKLKAQSEEWKAEAETRREEQRKQAEQRRKAEQKRLENDFGYLLENSGQDWRKYK